MMQNVFAIIPVKPLALGKSRLGGWLAPDQRAALNARLLHHTLDVATDFPGPARCILVSASPELRVLARRRGMIALADPEQGESLNDAVAAASQVALAHGAQALFVLPVDLPLLTAANLRRTIAEAPPAPTCLLIADQYGEGTNFLYQAPVRLLQYRYGSKSCARHAEAAWQAGLVPQIRRADAAWHDLDRVPDYRHLAALEKAGLEQVEESRGAGLLHPA